MQVVPTPLMVGSPPELSAGAVRGKVWHGFHRQRYIGYFASEYLSGPEERAQF